MGYRLRIVMSCAETGRVREGPMSLKCAEISEDTFFFYTLLPFILAVGLNGCETWSLEGRLAFGCRCLRIW
jgi:hypothetical protein